MFNTNWGNISDLSNHSTWMHYPNSKPTSLCSLSLMLHSTEATNTNFIVFANIPPIGVKHQSLPHLRATCFINRLESVFVINVIKFGQEKLVRPRKKYTCVSANMF
jgi:hypothetical protein